MNLQKFTVKAQEAVQRALEIAQSKNHQGVEPPHLLQAFLQDEGGLVPTLCPASGPTPTPWPRSPTALSTSSPS